MNPEGEAKAQVRSRVFGRGRRAVLAERLLSAGGRSERIWRDPKDGELCLSRPKPGETLVEGRSGSDVQIDRQTCV